MDEEYERMIKKICKFFLENPKKMIKEEDLSNFIQNKDTFDDIIGDVNGRFEQIGYDIIKTKFLNEYYYVLTSEGMDKELTPQMYGILAIIFGLNKEAGRSLTKDEIQSLFSSQYEIIDFLIEKEYLVEHQTDNQEYIILNPTAKVLFKNIISELTLKNILKTIGFD